MGDGGGFHKSWKLSLVLFYEKAERFSGSGRLGEGLGLRYCLQKCQSGIGIADLAPVV